MVDIYYNSRYYNSRMILRDWGVLLIVTDLCFYFEMSILISNDNTIHK